jgi:hypothetical protein
MLGFALGWLARGWWERTQNVDLSASPGSDGAAEAQAGVAPAAAFARGPVEAPADDDTGS